MKNYTVTVVVACLLIIACGSPLEWRGNVKGTYELMDQKDATSSAYPRPTPLDAGIGSARLYTGLVDHIRLGTDTPLPDCTFEVEKHGAIGETRVEFKSKNSEKAHTGEADDRKGCRGRVDKGGPLVSVDILYASVSLNSEGEIMVSVDYVPVDEGTGDILSLSQQDYTKQRVLYLKGSRGWL